MICPKCTVQMHQCKKIGGGEAQNEWYTTWELKECPMCKRKIVEFYSAILIEDDPEYSKILAKEIESVINLKRLSDPDIEYEEELS